MVDWLTWPAELVQSAGGIVRRIAANVAKLPEPSKVSCAARNRVINPQHYDCSDNGHDDAADINTGYAWAT